MNRILLSLALALTLSATGCANTPEEVDMSEAERQWPPSMLLSQVLGQFPTVLRGSQNVEVMRFYTISSTSGNLNFLTMQIVGDDDADLARGIDEDIDIPSHFSYCSIWNVGGPVIDTQPVGLDGLLTFNMSMAFSAWSRVSMLIECDMTQSAPKSGNPDIYLAWIVDPSWVEARDGANTPIPDSRVFLQIDRLGINWDGGMMNITLIN